MTRIGGIYEAFRSGDTITNGELEFAIAYFKRVVAALGPLGPIFHLSWCEAVRVLDTLEDFKIARNLK